MDLGALDQSLPVLALMDEYSDGIVWRFHGVRFCEHSIATFHWHPDS
jgi:hypothetical protein